MTALEPADTTRLAVLEATIGAGLRTFVEVGAALAEVRDSRLYRDHHETFAAYCDTRWGLSVNYAERLMIGARVVGQLAESGVEVLPVNEAQARELAREEPEKRTELWSRTVAETNGKPTAAAVRTIRARTTTVDRQTGEIVETQVDVLSVADKVDPAGADAYRLTLWRSRFIKAVTDLGSVTSFPVPDVASNADDQCIDELRRLQRNLADYIRRVDSALTPGPNVIRLESHR